MTPEHGSWTKTLSALSSVAYAVGAAKREPTIEELKSDLETSQESHRHANRSLTNMAVQLSDAMDRNVALSEEARKSKLEYEARLAAARDESKRLNKDIAEQTERADALSMRLRSMTDRAEELATKLKEANPEPKP
jgi:chromosome segregation ATPase